MKVYKTRTPEEEKEWLEFYTREGQNPAIVKAVLPKVEAIVVPKEVIEGIFTQAKPLFSSAVIVSSRRIFLHKPYPTGGAKMEEYAWQWSGGYDVQEDTVYCTFRFHFAPPGREKLSMKVDWLPSKQAKKLYQLANQVDGFWYFENRNRWLQDQRAKSGAVELHEAGKDMGGAGGTGWKGFVPSSQRKKEEKEAALQAQQAAKVEEPINIVPPAPLLEQPILPIEKQITTEAAPVPKSPAERLKHLKSLLDAGVISVEEFNFKKAEILASL